LFKLAEFQLKAIENLKESMEDEKPEVVFKSPTGSGKTIILTHFIDTYGKSNFNNVFVWLTPGKGDLEEQSKAKMDKYIPNSSTKLLQDVMIEGFEENDACFINWEKLTKKGNKVIKEGERTNFQEHISKAHNNNLEFIVIIDESHQNDTVKANDVIELFNAKKVIRTSATPKDYANVNLIEVPEVDVIIEGLIKKVLVINEGFGQNIKVENQISFLFDKALVKHAELKEAYDNQGSNVNPLIIVQLPNNNEVYQDEVERYLSTKNITYENNLLAVWLSERKQNLEDIEENNAEPMIIIIKQAIATGWDCPRAQILVKLRENTSETFEIQTIGRIRRMPEVKHYGTDLLDSCYLYTFDEKFTEGVKTHLGKGALDAVMLFLKKEYRDVSLITEYKSDIAISSDAIHALKTLTTFFNKEYGCTTKTKENEIRLTAKGYIFSSQVVKRTFTGNVHILNKQEFSKLAEVNMIEPLNTHRHGREYHNRISALGMKVGLPYEHTNTIIRRLFDKNVSHKNKLLRLDTKEVYAFAINNFNKLKEDFRKALSDVELQSSFDGYITEREIKIPKEFLFTYDGDNRIQKEYISNVYTGYISSAEIRSDSEKTFEKFSDEHDNVDWIYKNGDKGVNYLSIVYYDNAGKQKSFYPDYILSVRDEIWIIETKGGFTRSGASEDIDNFSPKKFSVLKQYLDKHNLKGGFVRKDKSNNELFICLDNYSDDISGEEWQLVSDVFI